MRLIRMVLTVAVILVVTGACGVVIIERGDMTERTRTLTEQQAWDRVEQHISAAVAILPVAPRLEQHSSGRPNPCDDPSDLGPRGRVSVSTTYWLRDLPPERSAEFFDLMHDYWLSNDYRILFDWRDREAAPALRVEHNADAFRMAMTTSVQGDLAISATSPCVWPHGTPPPGVAR